MSQEPVKVAPSDKDDILICPFDEGHSILRSRMAVHLVRCAPNHHGSKKVNCPFNITHICTITEMKIHVNNCPNRSAFEEFVNPDRLTAPCMLPHEMKGEIKCSENWDDGPDDPTYNPSANCAGKYLICNPQGNPPAVRRQIRDMERLRFQRNNKF
ncbi:gametocyte-specific factor 1 homolog [Drosophila guanche]|uniref:Blast:Gametocyte-specific factor 1 n=1 Tax=Drosophila guanche TaxID=7266 RepID=A0A3B0K3U2_DROGU|nr:gametocyte-specific factor 1 homolog [Drosophila guanche]SPP78098.1 blast:Gametocyte-specific factor 1 [Drosophila guanche]